MKFWYGSGSADLMTVVSRGLKFLKYTFPYRYLLELTAFVLQRGEAKAETAEEDGTHRRGGDCLQVISKA